MAWTISTYAGTRATGSPSNYRTAMFELCRAVKERSAAISGTTVSTVNFLKADGTITNAPSMADLYLMRCTGANSYAETNLVAVRNFITNTLTAGRWMTSDGGPTAYTVASMESAIGASLDVPTKVNEARAWQAYQDALDRMVYAYTELEHRQIARTVAGYRSNAGYGSLQLSWDNRTDVSITVAAPKPKWEATSSWQSTVIDTVTDGVFNFGAGTTGATLLGVLTSAEYTYDATFSNASISTIDFDVDGDTITVTADVSGGTATATPTMGAALELDISISTAEPSTVPFAFSAPDTGLIELDITGLNIYHKLTTILTDQA